MGCLSRAAVFFADMKFYLTLKNSLQNIKEKVGGKVGGKAVKDDMLHFRQANWGSGNHRAIPQPIKAQSSSCGYKLHKTHHLNNGVENAFKEKNRDEKDRFLCLVTASTGQECSRHLDFS